MFARLTVLSSFCLLLIGCASLDIKPENGDTVAGSQSPASVPITISWPSGNLTQGPVVDIDGSTLPSSGLTVTAANATGTVQLPDGAHTIRVRATETCWYCSGGTYQYDLTQNFTVKMAPNVPTVSISLDPQTPNPIDVPRGGSSTQINLNASGTNTTGSFSVTASSLPADVSQNPIGIPPWPNGTGATAISGVLSATPTARGSSNSTFTVAPSGGGMPSAQAMHQVRVIPGPGAFAFVQAPFLTNGPPTPTSPDGRFTSSVTRMDASRIWTYTIKKSGADILQVTVASKSGGSAPDNLGGLVFCTQPGRPTTTAIVVSDIVEDPNPPPSGVPAPSYDYRHNVKVISLDAAAPKVSTNFEVRYQYSVVPRVGFSPDCSIVAGWGSLTSQNHRLLSFVNGLSAVAGTNFEYDEANATSSFTASATVSGPNIVSTGSGGQMNTSLPPQ